jgi:hypothetical protein
MVPHGSASESRVSVLVVRIRSEVGSASAEDCAPPFLSPACAYHCSTVVRQGGKRCSLDSIPVDGTNTQHHGQPGRARVRCRCRSAARSMRHSPTRELAEEQSSVRLMEICHQSARIPLHMLRCTKSYICRRRRGYPMITMQICNN